MSKDKFFSLSLDFIFLLFSYYLGKMNHLTQKLAVFSVGLLLPLGLNKVAQATSFNFANASVIPQTSSSLSYVENGIQLEVTGWINNGSSGQVSQNFLGLGVTNTNLFDQDEYQLDGVEGKESLKLSFQPQVFLKSATFSRVGTNDDFTLTVNGNQLISSKISGNNSDPLEALDLGITQFSFNPSPTGNIFEFSVAGANDEYLLQQVDVENVPEPLTLLGSGSALLFGTYLKRKFNNKQKSKI